MKFSQVRLLVDDMAAAGPSEQREWGGRVVHLRDPAGNLIELFESIPMEE